MAKEDVPAVSKLIPIELFYVRCAFKFDAEPATANLLLNQGLTA
jgi:hypothetical protein